MCLLIFFYFDHSLLQIQRITRPRSQGTPRDVPVHEQAEDHRLRERFLSPRQGWRRTHNQAQQLSQKAAVVEKYYHQGIIMAKELLEALVVHFDDQKLDNFFQNAADEECKNQATGTETPTSSKYNCE